MEAIDRTKCRNPFHLPTAILMTCNQDAPGSALFMAIFRLSRRPGTD